MAVWRKKMLHTDIILIWLLNVTCAVLHLAAASGCQCYGPYAVVLLTPTRRRLPHGHHIYTCTRVALQMQLVNVWAMHTRCRHTDRKMCKKHSRICDCTGSKHQTGSTKCWDSSRDANFLSDSWCCCEVQSCSCAAYQTFHKIKE